MVVTPGIEGFFKPESVIGQFNIQEGMQIADFGSGAGHFAILMAQRIGKDGRVNAFDIMESALEALRARAQAQSLANIELKRANLEVLGSTGLPDGSQDMVLMANILFQSQKKAEIMREANRILKPGAQLVIIDWTKGAEGFGPPDQLRTDSAMMENLVKQEGFALQRSVPAGKFHHIMFFTKS